MKKCGCKTWAIPKLKENEQHETSMEIQLAKKKLDVTWNAICDFWGLIDPFKKDNVQWKKFYKVLVLLLSKENCPFNLVKISS